MGIRERLGSGEVSVRAFKQYLARTSNPADGMVGVDNGGNWRGITRNQNDDELTKTRIFAVAVK